MTKYAIGIDFGTESGRALLVRVADGREMATAVHPYANGVIDEHLPLSAGGVPLEPDWALQDPQDYIEVFKHAVPAVLQRGGVDPADVIGIATDFTACTMLPVKADGTPLCALPEYRPIRMPGSSSGSTTRPRPRRTGSTRSRTPGERPSSIATVERSVPSGLSRRSGRSSTRRRRSMRRRIACSRPLTGWSGG